MTTSAHSTCSTSPELLEESAEELYENAPCGYISTRPDGTLIKVNQTFLSWTGYSREELLAGKRLVDMLSIGGKIFHETHLAPLLRMQGFVNELQLELVLKDGHHLPILLNAVQKRDAAGNPLVHRITVFNITDRKKYERELLLARQKAEQATQAKADFLSMVSHEIRTPLNAIIGTASLLQRTPLTAQQQRYIRILRSSSDNLLSLLNAILDFSKIEAGKVALEERDFEPRSLVHSILFGLEVKAEEKSLAIRLELDERLPTFLRGDSIKIGQVLTNLVSNAIKFTSQGSVTLALRVRELDAETVTLDFRVTDTGIGIAQEHLQRIFEEFTQAHYDINTKYGGTGLGLAICQRLLALHGSRLSVESTPGRGSSFFFPLRLKLGKALEAPPPTASGTTGPSLVGVKMLVADDNDINVYILTQFLREWGVDFDVVGDGRQAIEKVRAGNYALVLMDLQMPELDGYDATRLIRSLPEEKYQQLPILALTASTRIGLEDRLESSGFTDFVGKPFKPEELFDKLVQYASQRP